MIDLRCSRAARTTVLDGVFLSAAFVALTVAAPMLPVLPGFSSFSLLIAVLVVLRLHPAVAAVFPVSAATLFVPAFGAALPVSASAELPVSAVAALPVSAAAALPVSAAAAPLVSAAAAFPVFADVGVLPVAGLLSFVHFSTDFLAVGEAGRPEERAV